MLIFALGAKRQALPQRGLIAFLISWMWVPVKNFQKLLTLGGSREKSAKFKLRPAFFHRPGWPLRPAPVLRAVADAT